MIQRKLSCCLKIWVLLGVALGCAKQSPADRWSFEYEQGKPQENTDVRNHAVGFTPLTNQIYLYATLTGISENPLPHSQQFVALGQVVDGEFKPVVRLGIHDGRRGSSVPAEVGLMYAYLNDGQLEYYGPWMRPNTPYDFKLHIDLDSQQMTAWVSGRGDDRWYLFAENVSLTEPVTSLNAIRVEQHARATGINKVIVQSQPSPKDESIEPHPLAKQNQVVGPDRGFKFQSMRSTWGQAGKHVTICRKNRLHFGFPRNLVRMGNKLFCVFENASHTGGAHQPTSAQWKSMGRVSICVSYDLGRTWEEPTRFPYTAGLDALRPGEHLQELSDGTVIDHAKLQWTDFARIKLRDNSTLIGYSENFKWNNLDCESVTFYRANDLGARGKSLGHLRAYPPHSISEPAFIRLPDGRLCAFIRESRVDHFPAVKAFSSDEGKTWQMQDLPFAIAGYPCPQFLRDGRVMVTFRSQVGRAALWAWVGDVDDNTPYRAAGVHFNDRDTVGLKDSALHIDNDGVSGQSTTYLLRQPDSTDTKIDLTVEVRVLANRGRAATVSMPFVGKFRIYSDHVELAHAPNVRAEITPGKFHTFRFIRDGSTAQLYVDGQLKITTDQVDNGTWKERWTPTTTSLHQLAFGSETSIAQEVTTGAPANWPGMFLPSQMHSEEITGYSIWRNFTLTMDDPHTGRYTSSWSADSGEFPDQYQLDHMIEIEASVAGADQGYSAWVELDDGTILVAAYTDDGAPTLWGSNMGISWMRGTFLEPGDLPQKER